jgi:hypothetical protein
MSKRTFVFALAALFGGLILMTIGVVGLVDCQAAVNSEGNATYTDESVTESTSELCPVSKSRLKPYPPESKCLRTACR